MNATTTRRETQTGGRDATTRHIPPKLALAVGMPTTPPPENWRWSALTKLARLESGHTPSRRHPEYWDGTVPWIGIKDAKLNHGRRIEETQETTNELGLANSSARLLPENTVCLSRTASVGYVVVMGRPMATSQDFVNWICSNDLEPDFLKYLFIAEGDDILRFASGAVHQTIYFPEAKAFHICHPQVAEQRRIVSILDEAFAGIATAKANAERNLRNARELFESYLNDVFTGAQTQYSATSLDALCQRITKGSSPKWQGFSYVREPGVLFVTSENVHENRLVIELPKYVEEGFNLKDRRSILRRGDVLTNLVGASIGRTAIFERDDIANVNQAVGVVTCYPEMLHNYYLMYMLNSPFMKRHFHDNEVDNARANISLTFLKGLEIPLPSLEQQRLIVTQIKQYDEQINRLESVYHRKLAALDELNKSLLHQAFNGKV
jgi:type I restriction enzyme S subunit